jgi:hypothetical protein
MGRKSRARPKKSYPGYAERRVGQPPRIPLQLDIQRERDEQEQEVQEQLALAHSKFLAGLGRYDIQYPSGD